MDHFSNRFISLVIASVCCTSVASALADESPMTQPITVQFDIDFTARHPISPFIYGVNPGSRNDRANAGLDQPLYANLNLTLVRLGGNRWTGYNWTNNASNAGADYRYQNDHYLGGGSQPAGAVIPCLQSVDSRHAAALVTIQMAGFVAKDFAGPQDPKLPPEKSAHFVPAFPSPGDDPHPAPDHVYLSQFVQFLIDHAAEYHYASPDATIPNNRNRAK